MKLLDLKNANVLARPLGNLRNVEDGLYRGIIAYAELVERESKFNPDGTRVVLNCRVEVENDNGELVDLYISPNYSWSKQGHMYKMLENLDALPKPGESIAVEDLVGIPVQVMVENVERDGETYSNIVRIKRFYDKKQSQSKAVNSEVTNASRRLNKSGLRSVESTDESTVAKRTRRNFQTVAQDNCELPKDKYEDENNNETFDVDLGEDKEIQDISEMDDFE